MPFRSRGRGPPPAGAASWNSRIPGVPGTPSRASNSFLAATAKWREPLATIDSSLSAMSSSL